MSVTSFGCRDNVGPGMSVTSSGYRDNMGPQSTAKLSASDNKTPESRAVSAEGSLGYSAGGRFSNPSCTLSFALKLMANNMFTLVLHLVCHSH